MRINNLRVFIFVFYMFQFAKSFYHECGNLSRMSKLILHSKKSSHVSFVPRTANQELYLKYLRNQDIKILFSIGPAGTGKTFLACNEAITLLKHNLISKIVLTRPVVPVEEDIGFLPGSLVKKMDPWTRPIIDIFEEKFSKQEVDNLIKNNIIEISPLGYMRGRTFKNAYIIADEMQNSSPNQMLMLTTRIGENSKMIITGDLKQTDKPLKSGLSDFITRFHRFRDKYVSSNENVSWHNYSVPFVRDVGIQIMEFNNSDIQRHAVVSRILEIYDDDDEKVVNNKKYIKYDLLKREDNSSLNTKTRTTTKQKKEIQPLPVELNKNQSYCNPKFSIIGDPNDAALIPKHLYKL